MNDLYFLSFAVGIIFMIPLWWDARSRPEYGKRPAVLLRSLIVFALTGTLLFVMHTLFGTGLRFLTYPLVPLVLLLYFIAIFLLEYSVHRQRIEKSHLTSMYKTGVRPINLIGILVCILIAGLWTAFHLITGINLLGLKELTDTSAASRFLTGLPVLLFLLTLALIAVMNILTIVLFGMQNGVIRQKRYPIIGTLIFIGLAAVLFFSRAGLDKEYPYWIFAGLNILYIVRVYHEYFFYRMRHLNDLHRRQEELEHNRTELINQVLESNEEEDIAIIKSTLSSFLDRLQKAVPNPLHVFKATMVFRKNGNVLAVDSKDFILNACTPLTTSETVKRMSPEDMHKHIMGQTFDIGELTSGTGDSQEDFATAAFRKAVKERTMVIIDPIPPSLKGYHKLIVLYPVINHDQVIGMLVLFKDRFDRVFPQEQTIVSSLLGNLSIMFAIMAGKKTQEEKNRLTGEMDIAKNIQTSILPRSIEFPGYETSAVMVTATEVGGDIYDYLPSTFGTYLDIGDVSGHGLPAGMMALIHMSAFHSAIRTAEILGTEVGVADVYDIVNRVLVDINRKRIGSDKFMTGNVLHERNGVFTHAGAHMIALLYRKDRKACEELKGMVDKTAFQGISEFVRSGQSQDSFTMRQGDILFLYTDGLTEARDRNDKLFGLENVKEVIERHAEEPVDAIRDAVLDRVAAFAAAGDLKKFGGKYADDVSLIVLRKV